MLRLSDTLSTRGRTKLSGLGGMLALPLGGAALGAIYGVGDYPRNTDSSLRDRSVYSRAAQGAITGAGALLGSRALPSLLNTSRFGAGILGGLAGIILSDRIINKDSIDPFYEYARHHNLMEH